MGKRIKIGDTQTEVRITHAKKSLSYFVKNILNIEYSPHLLYTMMALDRPAWVENSGFRYVRADISRGGIVWQGNNHLGPDVKWEDIKPVDSSH